MTDGENFSRILDNFTTNLQRHNLPLPKGLMVERRIHNEFQSAMLGSKVSLWPSDDQGYGIWFLSAMIQDLLKLEHGADNKLMKEALGEDYAAFQRMIGLLVDKTFGSSIKAPT